MLKKMKILAVLMYISFASIHGMAPAAPEVFPPGAILANKKAFLRALVPPCAPFHNNATSNRVTAILAQWNAQNRQLAAPVEPNYEHGNAHIGDVRANPVVFIDRLSRYELLALAAASIELYRIILDIDEKSGLCFTPATTYERRGCEVAAQFGSNGYIIKNIAALLVVMGILYHCGNKLFFR